MSGDISSWLASIGLGKYASAFVANEIDFETLRHLNEEDLRELGLPIGPRKKLQLAIENLPTAVGLSSRTVEAIEPPDHREAERRQLTLMFVDMVGSTALSARIDAEDLREVIRRYQNTVTGEIARYEGHVAKFMGDGVLVYFGYPIAHENDAERAVRAGLDVIDAMSGERETNEKQPVRIGIATGMVVVGDILGDGAAQEEAVVGETPNLAARLQEIAQPNSVVVSQSTRELLGNQFDLDELGEQSLKGFATPVACWNVKGVRQTTSRFEAARTGHLSKFVGRENELSLLLERWDRANDGEGQVVLLTGEAGIGKSRLTRALMDRIVADPHTRLRYQCSPFHINSALYPIISQLEFAAGFSVQDDTETKTSKLRHLLDQATVRHTDSLHHIASLLSIASAEGGQSPQSRKQNTFEAILSQLSGLASRQPVLLVFEDAHWSDPTSNELLEQMIEAIRDQRVFALVTGRPEYEPRWPNHFHITKLMLNRLGRRQIAEIVNDLSGGKTVPEEILEQIVAKTDGVPLFVEELTKTILESGTLEQIGDRYIATCGLPSLTIPSTLKDSLMARLDRLAVVKDVAQIGAAIGREFSHQLIAGVASLGEVELQAALDRLVTSELVYRRGTPPDATYVFKHALVQDAAYNSLLRERRRAIHQRIANELKSKFADRVVSEPEILAHHRTEGGDVEAAIPLWIRAGRVAIERIADTEAAEHFKKALSLLATRPDSAENRATELETQILLASSVMNVKGSGAAEVRDAYLRSRDLCDDVGDPSLTFQVLWGLWIHNTMSGRLEAGLGFAQEALALAKSTKNTDQLLQAHHAAWTSELGLGHFDSTLEHTKAGLDLYDIEKHRHHAFRYGGHDPGICAALNAAYANWFVGRTKEADTQAERTLQLARDVLHPFSTALAMAYIAQLLILKGEPRRAIPHIEDLLSYCDEYKLALWRANGVVLKNWAASDMGDVSPDVLEEFHDAIQQRLTMGSQLRISLHMAALAHAFARAGLFQEALNLIDQAFVQMEQSGERTWETFIHWVHGEILRICGKDNLEASVQAYRRAIEVSRLQGARIMELRSFNSLACCEDGEFDLKENNKQLRKLYDHISNDSDSPDIRDAAALLERLF